MSILDQYVTSTPSPQNAIDIFKGEWSSKLPDALGNLQTGTVPLFEDARIDWAGSQFGGFENKAVLELGPLEGGHTYMLEQAGASSITAIEANTRAYLKCLVVKEVLQLQRVKFLCGDFMEFLRKNQTKFDSCLASGVLYHMRNPAELIALAAKASSQLFIWTHYYDEAIVSSNPAFSQKFTEISTAEYAGFQHKLYRYEYQAALNWTGFCGGSQAFSCWMSRSDIIRCCEHFGFTKVEAYFEQPDHPNGASFALAATR